MPEVLFLNGVSFAYAETDVLHEVSLAVRGGEITALTGHNGSGKSTLLEIIAGVLKPKCGTVSQHEDLALVLQRPSAPESLPLTAREVVAMGTWKRGARLSRAAARTAVDRALERVDMSQYANRPLADLSGGQRQRIFLAQGIVRQPGALLLDEPATGLDRMSSARTQKILREEAHRGAIVLCATHHDEAIEQADRTIRLEEGRVVG
ncbi:metal ABC transporter ATP-binding protein [Leucobacter sp. UT-8R-CII-1-4]|uniref:metal ABC transporter ATP-binding protein n=1 Tax=Leucobacter sp. UT-8R-CII-1-4 TaxID=3040075 RepID=UPI0024A8A768|nr:metal ABC transporter ATP-binding protein [Leucobacter sp. UT-8R-CII-1-4]MDI6022606.1 metal ABC transporter ATP-binding protein [Leucobacter sp. UT-8R-CII-1-4]